jgi:arylsulfatase A-like enzyme
MAASVAGCSHREPAAPNVVLILVDTLRASRLPCHGYPEIGTPGIDRLVREGIQFETVISQVPVTAP